MVTIVHNVFLSFKRDFTIWTYEWFIRKEPLLIFASRNIVGYESHDTSIHSIGMINVFEP